MAFTEEDLDPSTDFTDGYKGTPTIIEGKGQRVFWQGCFVTAYEIGSDGKRGKGMSLKNHYGQGTIPNNVALYFAGHGGKVKEQ